MSEGNEAVRLPRWAAREAARRAKRGETFDPREAEMNAVWPENWTDHHVHGLDCLVTSGGVASPLFTEPLGKSADRILAAFPDRDPDTP